MKKQFPSILLTTLLLLGALFFCLPAPSSSANPWINFFSAANSGAPSTSRMCGRVTSLKAATATETGYLILDSASLTIAKGAVLPAEIAVGANVCFDACLEASGQLAGVSNVSVSNGSSVCGYVTSFQRASPYGRGSITIGGMTYQIETGVQLGGQNLALEGAYVCLTPALSNGLLTWGSALSASGGLQFTTPAITNGTTGIYGPPHGEDQFLLPQPMVFTVARPTAGASVFTANSSSFGTYYPLEGTSVQGLMLTTPNETVRATTCTDSFWDAVFQIAGSGNTNGDMVTFQLQNPDGSNPQTIAMFTTEGGAARINQVHRDVTLYWNGQRRTEGAVIPMHVNAGPAGLRTPALTFAIAPSSAAFNRCLQLAVEIKRGSGEGKTSLVISYVQVKRMESGVNNRAEGTGLFTGSLGWFPTGKVCGMACTACLPPPPVQPPGSLSGTVWCDVNNDGERQSSESGLGSVKIILTKPDGSTVETTTNGSGAYSFTNLPPGNYKITEVQPSGVNDGKDRKGTLGGDLTNDMVANIALPSGGSGTGYDFGELCPMPPKNDKCDTICWRSTQYFITFIRNLPGGSVLIPGVNANNPVGIQQNLNAVKAALQGGNTPMLRLSKEYVTGQLSVAGAGGQSSPVTFNTYWSPLKCSGLNFSPIVLSTGFVFTPDSLLNDLVDQTTLAVKQNRAADYDALASIWAMLNGRC